ncbi:hypothetical protein H1S01_05840 [Heliobacterium chlorum]|uniref:Cyclic nucleotide-binding domain-containing protein n=1 Tax=Heliobacterium chlorum TaxID=2698 RepID=A0ABR7SZR0_HELCL|nr:hypothetical protein [Heliobacterium chlorum]MBC9784033.1 hypothetical protein [Heliobacterium chlorum]
MDLRSVKIFEGMSTVDQARLYGQLERLTYPAGALLFEHGDQGDAMYVMQCSSRPHWDCIKYSLLAVVRPDSGLISPGASPAFFSINQ